MGYLFGLCTRQRQRPLTDLGKHSHTLGQPHSWITPPAALRLGSVESGDAHVCACVLRGEPRDHIQRDAPRFCGIPSKWNIERQLIVSEEDAALTSIGPREYDESLHLARGPNFEFHARRIGPYLRDDQSRSGDTPEHCAAESAAPERRALLPNYDAGIAARSRVLTVEGLRMTRRPLIAAIHPRAMIGEMNREYAPSGAQIPSLAHVVPPIRTSTTAATPAEKNAFEIIPARQSPNVPAMINIAAGNDAITIKTHDKSLSPDVISLFPEPAIE
jgi:hypothetical protein